MAGAGFYQGALNVTDPKVLDRELRPLKKVAGRRVLITIDSDPPEVPEGIEVIRAVDFFLG